MENLVKNLKILYQKGLFHVFIGTFTTKLITFFASVFLVRVLSKKEYGILGYLENIYGYILVLAGMGMSNSILRYVVLENTRQEKYNCFIYSVKKAACWNVILIIIVGFTFRVYPPPDEYQYYIWLIYVLLVSLPFQYITDNILCNERAMFHNQRYAVMSLFLSSIVVISKILSGKIGGIVCVIFSQSIVYIILTIIFWCSTKKTYYNHITGKSISLSKKKEINKYAFQYMITNGLWTIFMLNDIFLLGQFYGPETIAEYKAAYTIPGSVTLISTAIGIFIAPYFVKNENNIEWIKNWFKKIYLFIAGFIGIICIGIACFSKIIIAILYGHQYESINNIMIMLLLASFFNCGLRYTSANILAALGRVKYNMIISCIGIVVQIGINLVVIPVYGPVGVAITSCIVYSFMAVCLLMIFYKKYYKN